MRVVLIDDDAIVVVSLKAILEANENIEIAAMGTSGEEAIKLYEQYKPDVLLMDIRMNGMSGLSAGEKILEKHKDARILYLTTFMDDEYIVKALNIGARGYILKQDFEGQSVFGQDIVEKLPCLMRKKEVFDYKRFNLTDKEFEIIEELATGESNKEIAEKLFLSEGTVRNYISIILEKLELRDRTQLAIFYYKNTPA